MGLLYSLTVTVITIPLLYRVLLFEKENPYRTLLNQLNSKAIQLGIVLIVGTELLAYALYIFGPLNKILCEIEILLRSCLTIQQLLIFNAILIVRYIFLFHIKNPTSTQDDYWTLFLSIWSFGIGITGSIVFLILPGNNPNYFYICLGEIPSNHKNSKTKVNTFLMLLIFVTVMVHIVLGSKIKIFEKQEIFRSSSANFSKNKKSDKYNIFTVSSHLATMAAYLTFYFPAYKIQILDLQSFDKFPNYIWIYIFHLYSIQTFAIIFLIIHLIKNKPLFEFTKRQYFNFH